MVGRQVDAGQPAGARTDPACLSRRPCRVQHIGVSSNTCSKTVSAAMPGLGDVPDPRPPRGARRPSASPRLGASTSSRGGAAPRPWSGAGCESQGPGDVVDLGAEEADRDADVTRGCGPCRALPVRSTCAGPGRLSSPGDAAGVAAQGVPTGDGPPPSAEKGLPGADADAGGLEADEGGAFVVHREPDVDAITGVDGDAVRGQGVTQGSAAGVVHATRVRDGLDRRAVGQEVDAASCWSRRLVQPGPSMRRATSAVDARTPVRRAAADAQVGAVGLGVGADVHDPVRAWSEPRLTSRADAIAPEWSSSTTRDVVLGGRRRRAHVPAVGRSSLTPVGLCARGCSTTTRRPGMRVHGRARRAACRGGRA